MIKLRNLTFPLAAVSASAMLLATYACIAQPGPAPTPRVIAQAPAQAQAASGLQPAPIDRNGVLILVRSTMLALHHANETGNYTVLRDLGAPGFQAANTASRLSEIFANLRAQRIDLSGIAVLDPQLANLPQVDQAGMMLIDGLFPSVPTQVNFKLLFAPVEGRWRLFGISVGLGQATPAPPPQPQASQNPQAAPQSSAQPLATPTRPAAGQFTPPQGGSRPAEQRPATPERP
jgi:hypothetical protein